MPRRSWSLRTVYTGWLLVVGVVVRVAGVVGGAVVTAGTWLVVVSGVYESCRRRQIHGMRVHCDTFGEMAGPFGDSGERVSGEQGVLG